MKSMITVARVTLLIFLFIVLESGAEIPEHNFNPPPGQVKGTGPGLSDSQRSPKTKNHVATQQESKVTINVGEKNGFQYTVNGRTYSKEQISVSGKYYNDEAKQRGQARMYLSAEPSITYYAVKTVGSRLDVYAQNSHRDDFYFEILCPSPVQANDLRMGQINSTTVLVTGPSRSNTQPNQ